MRQGNSISIHFFDLLNEKRKKKKLCTFNWQGNCAHFGYSFFFLFDCCSSLSKAKIDDVAGCVDVVLCLCNDKYTFFYFSIVESKIEFE